ncbi:DUF6328 family protein [Streptomyces sp. MS19]|uniref:DUF6328 family protein n=1 Tax=Streptomyces sp. MS19 TaxID=3385972 RepID=UPI0039A1BF7E
MHDDAMDGRNSSEGSGSAGARDGRPDGHAHGVSALRDETPMERADRNFAELLQELRVMQTGVQMLFAFLLTLAFSARFPDLDTVQRVMYVVTLLLALVATVMFTGPAAMHRQLFGLGAKRTIVDTSSRLAGVGLAALGLSLTGALLLVVDVVFGRPAGIAVGASALALCLVIWVALPQHLRRNAGPGPYASHAETDSDRGDGR